jgi:hypothetical protein
MIAGMALIARDIPTIRRRVAEAVFFFRLDSERSDPASHTRTASIAPAGAMVLEFETPAGQPEVFRPTTVERQLLIDQVAGAREKQIEAAGMIAPGKTLLLAGGRILACHIDDSDWDGLSSYHSKGLVDAYDVPGWDTWLHLYRTERGDTLLAWIAPQFLEHADAAIWANPRKCLEWFREDELR